MFRDHLHRAGVSTSMAESRHVEEAFGSALLISISVALVAATITALAVTWYFTRRVQRSIAAGGHSGLEVAAGRYDARVTDPGLGTEFGDPRRAATTPWPNDSATSRRPGDG